MTPTQISFDCLIDFTQGKTIRCQDHTWTPVAHGVVRYTYRDRAPVEIDSIEAAKAAGKIIANHRFWSVDA